MTTSKYLALMEEAKHHGTQVGRASASSRGLDDWDAEALDAAVEAETAYLTRHRNNPEEGVR